MPLDEPDKLAYNFERASTVWGLCGAVLRNLCHRPFFAKHRHTKQTASSGMSTMVLEDGPETELLQSPTVLRDGSDGPGWPIRRVDWGASLSHVAAGKNPSRSIEGFSSCRERGAQRSSSRQRGARKVPQATDRLRLRCSPAPGAPLGHLAAGRSASFPTRLGGSLECDVAPTDQFFATLSKHRLEEPFEKKPPRSGTPSTGRLGDAPAEGRGRGPSRPRPVCTPVVERAVSPARPQGPSRTRLWAPSVANRLGTSFKVRTRVRPQGPGWPSAERPKGPSAIVEFRGAANAARGATVDCEAVWRAVWRAVDHGAVQKTRSDGLAREPSDGPDSTRPEDFSLEGQFGCPLAPTRPSPWAVPRKRAVPRPGPSSRALWTSPDSTCPSTGALAGTRRPSLRAAFATCRTWARSPGL
jgi:hypothetical protein